MGSRQPTDGSTQCHDDAATRTSNRRPRSSHSSNDDVSTSMFGQLANRSRASAAMPAPGSTAVTEHPSPANEPVACPVPQPTSSTADRSSTPVMPTRSATSSSGYLGRTRS